MGSGSLEKFIYTEKQTIPSLRLEKLLDFALGIAGSLEYPQYCCNIRIRHFDVNILLDEDLHPKISDFRLAKLCCLAESITSKVET